MNMCNVKRPLPVLLPCRGFFLGGYPEGGEDVTNIYFRF